MCRSPARGLLHTELAAVVARYRIVRQALPAYFDCCVLSQQIIEFNCEIVVVAAANSDRTINYGLYELINTCEQL